MSERGNLAFGFTVGPVMPAEQDGAAGDRQRYREMLDDCRFGQALGFGSVWVLEHHFTDYYPSPSPLLFLSHVAAACPGLGLGHRRHRAALVRAGAVRRRPGDAEPDDRR